MSTQREGEMPRSPWFSVPGPLTQYVDGFRDELDRLGYTPLSREYKVNQMGRLSRWLAVQGLEAADLDRAQMATFLVTMASLSISRRARVVLVTRDQDGHFWICN